MKALKIAAIVVGVAAIAVLTAGVAAGASVGFAFGALTSTAAGALGISTALASTILLGSMVAAVSSLGDLVAPKPSMGGQQTKWKADPNAGIPYAIGRTLVAGNIVMRRGVGKNNVFQTFVTVLSLGTAASIDATFMDKSRVTFSGTGEATGAFAGKIWQRAQLGALPEPAALTLPVGTPPDWTAQHKLSGLVAVMNTFKYDAKDKKGLTQIPQPAWIGKFVKVYDPRLDSTYPGGSGPCRAYDEATYVWSEDPHLHGLTWAMGRYHNGVRVAGIGIGDHVPDGRVTGIDVASFVEGANLNDVRGWKAGGVVYTRPDPPWNSLQAMLQAGGARAVLNGGRITAINRAPRVSLATIRKRDIVGECSFAGTQPRRSRINTIVPTYRSEGHDWEMVPAKPVSVPGFVAMDGGERTRDVTYPLVQDVDQAAQLATYDIYDAREAGPGTVALGPAWLNYRAGDALTFAPEDDVAIKVIVGGRALEAQNATVTLTIMGETDEKHPFALGRTGMAPPVAALAYSEDVLPPDASDWTLEAVGVSVGGLETPALRLVGSTGASNADAVLIQYRKVGDSAWIDVGIEAPSLTEKLIPAIESGAQYEAAVSYRIRGRWSDPTIYGPATAAANSAWQQQLIATSWQIGLTLGASDTTITIGNHQRAYSDRTVNVAGTTLPLATTTQGAANYLYYDDAARAGGAVTWHATTDFAAAQNSAAHPARHFGGYVSTPAAGGSSSGGGSLPPGSGGADPYQNETVSP